MTTTIITGDCRDLLPTLTAGSVQCCVTSPPYWNLRDYGHPDQIGNEPTVDEYVANLVDVFRGVHRVLRDDGTLWVNLGSTYGKRKQLVPVPWLVGLALQSDGWIFRRDNIWNKPNAMPDGAKDRTTTAHEYVLHFSKAERYFYDAAAIAEKFTGEPYAGRQNGANVNGDRNDRGKTIGMTTEKRNKRSVWTITTSNFTDAHFATFPEALVEPCILAGSREGDTILDPFAGSGTTLGVANRLGRHSVGIELNPEYVPMIERRTAQLALTTDAA